MNILIPLVSSFGREGGWRVISQLANHWILAGHKVFFLAPDSTEPYYPTRARIFYYDYRGKIIDEVLIRKKSKTLIGPFQNRFYLHKAIESFPERVDVILATHNFTALPVAKSKRQAKKFYYIQAYEPEYYEQGPFWYRVYKQAARKSYALPLQKIVNADMYKDYHEIKTEMVVYPGIDTKLFSPSEKEKPEGKIILGSIGRTEPYKGTSYILEAFSKLRKQYQDQIELHLAFGDKLWEQQDGVRVFFPDGDEALANFYKKLDIYISAGVVQLDAIHYPVLEAMATKVPLVTTGYYPADQQNAWMVPVKDIDAISEKVSSIIEDLETAQEKAEIAFQQVSEFSWDIISQKMLNYFNK